jgi:hypothetical protein
VNNVSSVPSWSWGPSLQRCNMQQEMIIISALVNHSHYLPAIWLSCSDFLASVFCFVLTTRPTTTIIARILYSSLDCIASEGRMNFELWIANTGERFVRGTLQVTLPGFPWEGGCEMDPQLIYPILRQRIRNREMCPRRFFLTSVGTNYLLKNKRLKRFCWASR